MEKQCRNIHPILPVRASIAIEPMRKISANLRQEIHSILCPLLQQGSTLLQLSRQVQPVRIACARHSLAPTGGRKAGRNCLYAVFHIFVPSCFLPSCLSAFVLSAFVLSCLRAFVPSCLRVHKIIPRAVYFDKMLIYNEKTCFETANIYCALRHFYCALRHFYTCFRLSRVMESRSMSMQEYLRLNIKAMFQPFVAARFYLVATIPTGSTCQNSLREAQPRTNREVAGCLY